MRSVLLLLFFTSPSGTGSVTVVHQDVVRRDLRVVASQVEGSKHRGRRLGEVRVSDNSGADAYGVSSDKASGLGRELLRDRHIRPAIC